MDRLTNKMSATAFGVQKAAFLASWSVLVDNYTTKKSDEKLDSLEKILMWMSQLVRMCRHQANSTRNKRKKNCDEKEIGDTVPRMSQQSPPQQHAVSDILSFSQQQHQEPCCSQDVVQTLLPDMISQSWMAANDEKWKQETVTSLDFMDNFLTKMNTSN